MTIDNGQLQATVTMQSQGEKLNDGERRKKVMTIHCPDSVVHYNRNMWDVICTINQYQLAYMNEIPTHIKRSAGPSVNGFSRLVL